MLGRLRDYATEVGFGACPIACLQFRVSKEAAASPLLITISNPLEEVRRDGQVLDCGWQVAALDGHASIDAMHIWIGRVRRGHLGRHTLGLIEVALSEEGLKHGVGQPEFLGSGRLWP